MSTERVIVDRSIASDFESVLREAAKDLQGKRFDLVRKNGVDELKTLVDDAIQAVRPPLLSPHLSRHVWSGAERCHVRAPDMS